MGLEGIWSLQWVHRATMVKVTLTLSPNPVTSNIVFLWGFFSSLPFAFLVSLTGLLFSPDRK